MSFHFAAASVPVVALAVNVAVHVSTSRYLKGISPLKALYLGFGAGLFAQFFASGWMWVRYSSGSAEALYLFAVNTLSFGSLSFCYFNFVNMGNTARRVRLVIEMSLSEKPLTYQDILKRYNAREQVEKRIKRLVDAGQVKVLGNRYYRKPSLFLMITRAIIFMKWLVMGKTSEFDHG